MGWTEGRTGTAHGGRCVVLHLDGPLTRAELAELCRRVDTLIRQVRSGGCGSCGVRAVVCDIAALDVADLGLVDQLARVQLTARRAGGTVTFRRAGMALRALLTLVGLDEVLTDPVGGPASSVERQRQAEQGEDAGVEKDIEVHHPPL